MKKVISVLLVIALIAPYLMLIQPIQAQGVSLVSVTPDRPYLYPGEEVNVTIQTSIANLRVTVLLRHTYNAEIVYYANTTVFPEPGVYSIILKVPHDLFGIGDTTYQVLWIQIIAGAESLSLYRDLYPLITVYPGVTTILDENELPTKITVAGYGFEEGATIYGFYIGEYYYELLEPVQTNSSGMFVSEFYLIDVTGWSIPMGDYEVYADSDAEFNDYQHPGVLSIHPIAFIHPSEGSGSPEELADIEVYGFGFPASTQVASIQLCSVNDPSTCYIFPIDDYSTDPDGFLYISDLSQYNYASIPGGVYCLVVETVDGVFKFPNALYSVYPYIRLIGPDVVQPNEYIWFEASGFQPGATISVYLDGVLITQVVTDENGFAEFYLPVPELIEEGPHTIYVTDGVFEAYFQLSSPFAIIQPSQVFGKDSEVYHLTIYGYGFLEGTGVSEVWLCSTTCYVFPIGDVYADDTGFIHIAELGSYLNTNMSLGQYRLLLKLDNNGVLASSSHVNVEPLMEVLSGPSVKIGGEITIALYGFAPGEMVDVYLAGRLIYSDAVDVDGNATFHVTVPLDIPGGPQELKVVGRTSGPFYAQNTTIYIEPSAYWIVLDYEQEPKDYPRAYASYNGTQIVINYPTGETVYLGDYIKVEGYGFAANETVGIYIGNYLVATVKADASGRISVVKLIPSIPGGIHVVRVEGEVSGPITASWMLDDAVTSLEVEGRIIAAALNKNEPTLEGSGIIRLYGSGLKPGTVFKAVLVNGTDALMFYAPYIQTSWHVDSDGLLKSLYGFTSLTIPFSQPGFYVVTLFYEDPDGNEYSTDLPVLVIIPLEITQRLDDIEARLSDIEAQIATLQAQIDALLGQLEALNQTITQRLIDLQGMIDDLQAQLSLINSTLAGDIALLGQRISSLESMLAQLSQELDALSSQISDVNSTLLARIEDLQERLNNAFSTIQELSSRINELEQELASLSNTLNNVSSSLNGLQTTVGDLNSQLNALENKVDDLSRKLDEASSTASTGYSLSIIALIFGLIGAAIGVLAYTSIRGLKKP
ncbi:MAG: hypothetical protein QXO22_02055 [Thermosphaera sp.]